MSLVEPIWSRMSPGMRRLAIQFLTGLLTGLLLAVFSSMDVGPIRGEAWFEFLELRGYD